MGMLIISKIDYHIFARFSVAAYLMSYILMIAVSFVGKEVNGKKRWLPLGPFSFQPRSLSRLPDRASGGHDYHHGYENQ